MTAPTRRQAQRTLALRHALLPAVLLSLLPLGSLAAGTAAPQNTIRAIQTVHTGASVITYNITLTSSAEFPMNDSVVTLSIGGKEFINSSYGPGGTLNTLVFSLTRAQFLSLKNGAPVAVYYGPDNAASADAQWNFGTLDLSLLDQAAPTSTVQKGK